MSIRLKVLLPVLATVLTLGGTGLYLLRTDLGLLQHNFVRSMVMEKEAELAHSIATTSSRAREMAALFSRTPEVVQAFRVALSGNINDENDPAAQEARVQLRAAMVPVNAGYSAASDGKLLQLHFHLPNARSLLRAWRKQQTQKNGVWVDISDDLASFRQTVLDVNKTGQTVEGIELGRGGFAIRGLAPVRDESGTQLGSVEVLLDFDPILKAASEGEGRELLLYMNADRLSIARNLNDPAKYPVADGRFVLVSNSGDARVADAIPIDLLDEGSREISMRSANGLALAAFPVRDYKGSQIGLIVYAMDTDATDAIIRESGMTIGGVLLAILILPALVTWLFISRSVVRPIQVIIGKIRDIAEDRADLNERLDDSANDEMGGLASWFNVLMVKLSDILTEVKTYMYIVNAVPDPIFTVDDNMKILVANEATARFGGKDLKDIKGTSCRDIFNTALCGTRDCPIQKCKERDGHYEGDVIQIAKDGREISIKPTSDVLRDASGRIIGRMEVARNVTELVEKERGIQTNLERISEVNDRIMVVAAAIAESSATLLDQVSEAASGAQQQKARAMETATAMEEMNATVIEVASNAANAASRADETRSRADDGATVVERAVEAMSEVRARSLELRGNMENLGELAEGIGKVLGVITDIADQTNLLALNAAIEAARAGDAGRGFAVVADEVRKLAEKTMTATKEVDEAIQAIQNGTRDNAESVSASDKAVERATQLVNESGQALEAIRALVDSSADQVRAIATAAEQQSATSDEISNSVGEVSRVAESTADGMDTARTEVRRMAELAEDLRRISSN
ncbi:MAG: PAS domain-containing protein [Pseudodesulfovibrio sp.]|nr:PAS domain-containing protein [Pseudomonadota bacterium]MBV1764993.1 PAS domain-containing protein [Pseudodesulfovibrio sp.]MBU4475403.1 PAS domain-containing protein [Pseudomonadota bacterium]MBU4514696.1 PAS domain-containing protein [Pseudomonadota bacterium]MBU4522028.1 PAS domain-containing protein [Pseudomonadota bacterium]